MKINMNVNRVVNIYNQNSKETQAKSRKQTTGDKVEISNTGKEIAKYIELSKDTEIRNSRVDEIRELIKDNKYSVDSEALARSIAKYIKERDI